MEARALLRTARAALAAERAALRAWRGAALGAAGLGWALLAGWPLWVAVPGAALAAWGLARARWPGRAEAGRYLEARAGLAHRPASTLDDALAGGDPVLWALARLEKRAALAGVRAPWPAVDWARADPRCLCGAAALTLLAGAVVALAVPGAPAVLGPVQEKAAADQPLLPGPVPGAGGEEGLAGAQEAGRSAGDAAPELAAEGRANAGGQKAEPGGGAQGSGQARSVRGDDPPLTPPSPRGGKGETGTGAENARPGQGQGQEQRNEPGEEGARDGEPEPGAGGEAAERQDGPPSQEEGEGEGGQSPAEQEGAEPKEAAGAPLRLRGADGPERGEWRYDPLGRPLPERTTAGDLSDDAAPQGARDATQEALHALRKTLEDRAADPDTPPGAKGYFERTLEE